jgi:two-component system sensor histidine kinase HydH
VVVFNRKAAEAFGYSTEEALALSVDELFTRPVAVRKYGGSDGRDEVCHEVVCRTKDGSQFPAYLAAAPVMSVSGDPAAQLFILNDISESKNFQEMMVKLDRYYTRGEMAGDIAHEINNYLAVLSGNLELMPLFMKRGEKDKIESKLSLMKKTVDKIARFTDGLMDVDQGNPRFAQTDVNQLIQNMLAFVKPQNRFDRVEIHADLASDVPLIEIDAGMTQQILINLLHNASDAISETDQPGDVWVSSRLCSTESGKSVRIEVRDSGPGVSEENIDKLFRQRFTTKRKGHGYGLVSCQRIMESHGGKIRYNASSGSAFLVEFPVGHACASTALGLESEVTVPSEITSP